jgi:hypothetical protein
MEQIPNEFNPFRVDDEPLDGEGFVAFEQDDCFPALSADLNIA